jgi:hypothetical protein
VKALTAPAARVTAVVSVALSAPTGSALAAAGAAGAEVVPSALKPAHPVVPVLPVGQVGEPVPVRTRAEARRLFLEQSATTLGQSWADQWRDDLRREGRPAAGGWPGTLREARVRVEHHLLAEVTRRRMPAVTEAEREVAARRAYASARAQWCRQAEPEAP